MMDPIKILESLEPVFIEAGELACKMQGSAKHYNKFETGNPTADIVTEADLAVQEFLLEAISKTELVNCRLMAEENTPQTEKFNKAGGLYLAIDPIDDTAIYAKGGKYFSQIISLHDGKKFLYMFIRFPALNWTHKIVNNQYSVMGQAPEFDLSSDAKNTIVYWDGEPEKRLPQELLADLKNKGIKFAQIKSVSKDVGSIVMFSTGRVAGIYHEDMNAYDSFSEYNIALAKNQKIYTNEPNHKVDLKNIQVGKTGLYYPGYYLALID